MKKGITGARMQVKIILTFAVMTILPTVFMTIFSMISFHRGLDAWFSEKNILTLNNSIYIAEKSLAEHKKLVLSNIEVFASDLTKDLEKNIPMHRINNKINRISELYNFDEILLFDDKLNIVTKSDFTFAEKNDYVFSPLDIGNTPVIMESDMEDVIKVVIKVPTIYKEYYLVAKKFIDYNIIDYFNTSNQALKDYNSVEARRFYLQSVFSLMFVFVSVFVLILAVWISIVVISKIIKPITALAMGAEHIKNGNFNIKISYDGVPPDMMILIKSFNNMIYALKTQKSKMLMINKELEKRHNFIDSLLQGIISGIIVINKNYIIEISNQSAKDILNFNIMEGEKITNIFPEITTNFAKLSSQKSTEFHMEKKNRSKSQDLLFKIIDMGPNYLINFVDITDILGAQKHAAWSNVARRLAHEIKNPLTPIQLGIERIKRKYLKEVKEKDVFEKSTVTILKQVSDIKRMVDEFSVFARMPSPKKEKCNLEIMVKDIFHFYTNAYSDIEFNINIKTEHIIMGDKQLLRSVISNIVINAVQSINEHKKNQTSEFKGIVTGSLIRYNDSVIITIDDNGSGLSSKVADDCLTDPYITTKAGGTGLGLSVSKKVIEDHGGDIKIKNKGKNVGVCVSIYLPCKIGALKEQEKHAI